MSPVDRGGDEPREQQETAPGGDESRIEPETVREVERKYRVHGLFRLPDLAPFVADDPRHDVLEATYVDTDDLRLARWGVTMRRRVGGLDEGWHLKLPVDEADRGVRDEVRVPLESGAVDQPPAPLADVVTAYVRGAMLRPVATLRTERVTRVLRDSEGGPLSELTDDSVSVLDGDRVAARFRELELEDSGGGDDALDAVESLLTASGAVRGAFVSKATRALGPLATAPPDVEPAGTVGPGDPAGDAVQAHLATHVRALLLQDVRLRRGLPDAVHQMRVAARRLRSGLKVFGPLVDEEWSDHLRDELKWLADNLGGMRDREVLEKRLLRDLDTLARLGEVDVSAASALVRRTLDDEMADARTVALEAVRSERHLALLQSLVDAAREPRMTDEASRPARDALPPLVAKAWKRLSKDVGRLEIDGPDDDWHETRIAAKRTRYAAEAVIPVFGKPARKLAEQVEEITELLGEHQDAAVAAHEVQRIAVSRGVRPGAAFALGLLHAEQRRAVDTARTRFVALWPDVSRRRWRRWLEGG